MVIDVHTHLFGTDKCDKELVLKAMDRYQIDKVYLSTILGDPYPSMALVEAANAATAQFMKEQPGKIEGYVYISPEHPNALDVLKRGIEDKGMAGIKLWISSFCDDPVVDPIAEQAMTYGIPVLIHSFHKTSGAYLHESNGFHVGNLARRFPKLKIIMAHLGGNAYHGIPCICDCPNVWVDYCLSSFFGDALQYTLDAIGPERVLHASDMPGNYIVNLGKLLETDLTEAERELVLYRNAQKLFDRSFKL